MLRHGCVNLGGTNYVSLKSYQQPRVRFRTGTSVPASASSSVSTTTTSNKFLLKEENLVLVKQDVNSPSTVSTTKGKNPTADTETVTEIPSKGKNPAGDAETVPSELSSRWREIQGANHWEGLLEPLDSCLRAEIIRYGEFAQACYDAFNYNSHSKHCGLCKYNKADMFDMVGLPDRGYTVTKYIYATSDPEIPLTPFFKEPEHPEAICKECNWIGFVAVADNEAEIKRLGRRDIVVAWRGTVTSLEWAENLKDFLIPAGLDHRPSRTRNRQFPLSVKVESGFLHLYTSKAKKMQRSAREQLLWEIHRLVGKYKGEQLSITVTGHSLGGALALLSGYDIAESGMDEPCPVVVSATYREQGLESGSMDPIFELPLPHNEDDDPSNNIPVTVFSFSAPRVGNNAFRDRCEELGIKVLRVVNQHDVVPKMPGLIFNEQWRYLRKLIDQLPWTYSHVGKSLKLSSLDSPHLQQTMNVVLHHNLEAHLHLLDGYIGLGCGFCSATDRDVALVNKACDFLKPECNIPPVWWQDMHKGLIKNAFGKWVQPEEYHDDDLPRL